MLMRKCIIAAEIMRASQKRYRAMSFCSDSDEIIHGYVQYVE